MKKIQLGQWTIRTAKSLKDIIILHRDNAAASQSIYWQLVGIYDTRVFGLVFYRNGHYNWTEINQPQ